MAYHIGRVMHEAYGLEVACVGSPPADGMFTYPIRFPVVDRGRFLSDVGPTDILVCNPSFSDELFGLRLNCRTLSYIQGIRTYTVLDVFFDLYVFVSEAVRRFVGLHYGIEGTVIPAFIRTDIFQPGDQDGGGRDWERRRRTCVVLERKLNPLVFETLRRVYQAMHPGESLACEVVPVTSQQDLAERFRGSRVFLSLDAMEGFGLPMLEAMACGCAVVGWDSLGCREYAKPGENCLLARYGDFEDLARKLHTLLAEDATAQALASQGPRTARGFGVEQFDRAWTAELRGLVEG
jgi:glycosyltransferase involved in cell wall biosynthesis